MVDEANEFRTNVFSKRNEYLAITEPIEKKFKDILDAEEARKVMEARKELLPSKKQALSTLDISQVTDDFILFLDDEQWVAFFQEKVTENQNNIARKEADKKREQERAERDTQIKKEAEERAEKEKAEIVKRAEKEKADALIKAEKDKADAIAKIERDAKEKADKEKRDKELADRKAKEAQEKLEADKKYKKFLADNNFDSETDLINRVGSEIKIYRLVATFNE
jgi:hypothetical protein